MIKIFFCNRCGFECDDYCDVCCDCRVSRDIFIIQKEVENLAPVGQNLL